MSTAEQLIAIVMNNAVLRSPPERSEITIPETRVQGIQLMSMSPKKKSPLIPEAIRQAKAINGKMTKEAIRLQEIIFRFCDNLIWSLGLSPNP